MHAQHISRLTHLCPSMSLHWYNLKDANFSEITLKQLGKSWESEVAEVVKVSLSDETPNLFLH